MPGSVAATVINQINKDGGTGFIGGQHVHHHGAAPAHQVTWELLKAGGSGYELRNTGNAAARDVSVDSNVDLAWPAMPLSTIASGAGMLFICEPGLADPAPVITVQWATPGSSDHLCHRGV